MRSFRTLSFGMLSPCATADRMGDGPGRTQEKGETTDPTGVTEALLETSADAFVATMTQRSNRWRLEGEIMHDFVDA